MNSHQPDALEGKRIWVAGHRGMLGAAVCRQLETEDCEILSCDRASVDLRRQQDIETWIGENRPDAIIIAAARVGGIQANNTLPAEFLYDNLMIEANVVHAAFEAGVEKLLLLGSSCIYPKFAPQPISEFDMLSGPLEPTNQWYAIAKIAGVMLCQAYQRQHGANFISAMPTNLYGPGDFFSPEQSHVIPGLMVKFHEAKLAHASTVPVWGTGTPRREFLHVDDAANGLVHTLKAYSGEPPINVGSGSEVTIAELAQTMAKVVGFNGTIEYDRTKPDGTPRKLIDSGRLRDLGWAPTMSLTDGLTSTYDWYLQALARDDLRGT